jgi:cellulose synthase (UDP-forming)
MVARGLVPADLRAYLIQQLKWSRGVFEILVQRSLPRLLHLSGPQAICYATRMSYYLIGPVTFLSMSAVGAILFLGQYVAQYHLASYIVHFVPATAGIMLVRTLAATMWEQDPEASLFHFPGLALAIGTWPVYTYAFGCALLRVQLPHLPTPKRAESGRFLLLVVPQLGMVVFLLAGVVWRALHGLDLDSLIIVGFALLLVVSHWAVFYATWEGRPQGKRAER